MQSIVFRWEAAYNPFNAWDWLRKHYIYLDGYLSLLDENGVKVSLQPARQQVEDKKDLSAVPFQ